MKNIVICFDGTWNTSDSKDQTNVVKTARLLTPKNNEDKAQVVFYDAGVGSGQVTIGRHIDTLFGGAFGWGLMQTIEHAYRFLTFNYVPGDKIFVFGFSRGAFSARSLCGLIYNCGILKKDEISRVKEAIEHYQNRDPDTHPDAPDSLKFRGEHSMAGACSAKEQEWRANNPDISDPEKLPLSIEYLGIWDTVGALGIPKHLFFADRVNAKYRFHSTTLSPFVKHARHALALDERRRIFDATPWKDIEKSNKDAGASGRPVDQRPYQQLWFPGDHGSVGGGGDLDGLSNITLVWILDGAVKCGLGVDTEELDRIRREGRNEMEQVDCMKNRTFDVLSLATRAWRQGPGETDLDALSEAARNRYFAAADQLPKKRLYRPGSLKSLAKALARAHAK